MQETGFRLDFTFQTRQLLVADMVYLLNGLTGAFRQAISQAAARRATVIGRDEYALRINQMRHEGRTEMDLRVAATKKGMALADDKMVAELKVELCHFLYETLTKGDSFGRVASFQKAMAKKSPRLSELTVRLIERLENGEDRITAQTKLT
jgi:hypothetical protein